MKRLRTFVIDWTISGINWVSENVTSRGVEGSDFWFIIGDILDWPLSKLFGWAWEGSNEEIRAVYNGEIPPVYMSDRQRAVMASDHPATCIYCDWEGRVDETDGFCPECDEAIHLHPIERPAPEGPRCFTFADFIDALLTALCVRRRKPATANEVKALEDAR